MYTVHQPSLVKQDSFQVESDQKNPSAGFRPPAKMEHQRSKPPTLALKKRAWIMHPSSVVVGNLIYIITQPYKRLLPVGGFRLNKMTQVPWSSNIGGPKPGRFTAQKPTCPICQRSGPAAKPAPSMDAPLLEFLLGDKSCKVSLKTRCFAINWRRFGLQVQTWQTIRARMIEMIIHKHGNGQFPKYI